MAADEPCAAQPHACGPSGTVLPSLLLIGTRKGGTTALANLLRDHPQIIMPNCKAGHHDLRASQMCVWDKEVRYFSRGVNKGIELCWYRNLDQCPVRALPNRRPSPSHKHCRQFNHHGSVLSLASPQAHGDGDGVGGGGSSDSDAGGGLRDEVVTSSSSFVGFDASPDYMVIPDAAISRMASQLGKGARLVLLLRNPADRFYSAYNMGMNEHLDRRRSVRRASSLPPAGGGETDGEHAVSYGTFARELDRLLLCAPTCAEEPAVVAMFFNYGLYARHIQRFAAHFGMGRLLIERSEDFYEDASPTVSRVLAFAGLREPPAFAEKMRRAALTRSARNDGGLWGGSKYAGRLLHTERRKLQDWYAPHNAELYALMGRDMQWEVDAREQHDHELAPVPVGARTTTAVVEQDSTWSTVGGGGRGAGGGGGDAGGRRSSGLHEGLGQAVPLGPAEDANTPKQTLPFLRPEL
jgi:uncharacterized membrane protein YgcG